MFNLNDVWINSMNLKIKIRNTVMLQFIFSSNPKIRDASYK